MQRPLGDSKAWDGYVSYLKYGLTHNSLKYRNDPYFGSGGKIKDLYGLMIPSMNPADMWELWEQEFGDIVIPYILELNGKKYNFKDIDIYLDEGPYELNENVSIKKNDVVIDCGANMGLFSAIASKKGAVCYAFEPSEKIRERYTKVTAQNNPNIIICPYALGHKVQKVYFYTNIKQLASSKISEDRLEDGEEVRVITLDKFVADNHIQKVDFIKADIEGAERDMLQGAKNILKKMNPKLSICAYHLADDKEVLEDIILSANPKYNIEYAYKKLYAYVPQI